MPEDILEAFKAETGELLEAIEGAIGDLEAGRKEAVEALFRHIHTVKGSAGILGMARLEAFAHAWESRLSRVRQGLAAFGPASYALLETCRGRVSAILEEEGPRLGAGPVPGRDEEEGPRGDARVLEELDRSLVAGEPPEGSRTETSERLRELRERNRGAAAGERPKTDALARVPASKLEKILSCSSEMVVALSNFSQSARAAGADGLAYELAAVQGLAATLYRTVLEARMVPFGEIAGRFVRAVEEIARDRGKKIRFVLSGADTEIDKSLADRLVEPLLHLVRNAADHGIEAPEARLEAGKPAEGLVALRASRESGLLGIRVEDDGAGIEAEAIRARALALGRIAETDRPNEGELFDLLFESGFSLSPEVTRWSGRGVGLDAVKRSVAALRGAVRIESSPGRGTTALVRLPLALSLVEGFVARVGSLELLVPFDAAKGCVEVGAGTRAEARGTLPWGGSLVPAIDLAALYGEPRGEGGGIAVLVEDSGSPCALLVDEVGETISAAVRPLDRRLADAPGLAGSAVLGDGSMVLVLDAAELSLMARRSARPGPAS